MAADASKTKHAASLHRAFALFVVLPAVYSSSFLIELPLFRRFCTQVGVAGVKQVDRPPPVFIMLTFIDEHDI
jgi:hypothetical protein